MLAAAKYLQHRLTEDASSRNNKISNGFDPAAAAAPCLRPNEGLVCGDLPISQDGVEMMVASLIQQGLLHGFLSHSQRRFAVIGAKAKGGPVAAGWPPVLSAIVERKYDDEVDWNSVPGWVKG